MKILYVMGTGRSGTTILEIVLKASENIDGYGEITHFPLDGFLENVECSCGERAHQCEQWSKVTRLLSAEQFIGIEKINGAIEQHKRFWLTMTGLVNRGAVRSYEKLNGLIFSSLSCDTGSQILVDSSKYPGRALALGRLYGSDIMTIGVTRCPYELLSAFQKNNEGEQLPKSYISASLYYMYVTLCMRLASLFLKRFVAIRYEQFVQDPVRQLEQIEQKLCISLAESKQAVAEERTLDPGHIVTGNRLRKNKNIIFRRRERKEELKLPWGARVLAGFLTIYRNILGF